MELKGLLSYKSAFRLTRTISIAVVVISITSVIVGFLIMNQRILEIRDTVVVIDRSGQVLDSERMESKDTRIFEYENHVRTFYNLWYSFDEGSYQTNIEMGLNYIGESGKDLLDVYLTQNVERNIRERNLVFNVYIENIQIDMSTNPVTGYIEGIQEIKRNRGEIKRKLDCTFIIYDVDRTRNNPHGCKVDNWKIVNDKIIN